VHSSDNTIYPGINLKLVKAVKNGKPLPKGHGPLIDVNKLEPDTEWDYYEDDFISYSRNQIESAEVVVEADDPEEREDL